MDDKQTIATRRQAGKCSRKARATTLQRRQIRAIKYGVQA